VVRHPVTGQHCWFNQIPSLNEWTIAPEVREYLVDVSGAEGLPFNTRYGNGDPIGEDVGEHVPGSMNDQRAAHAVGDAGPRRCCRTGLESRYDRRDQPKAEA
jgi:hypothetical protein